MKRIYLFIAILSSLLLQAQKVQEIDLLPDEYWWGGFTGLGYQMPYKAETPKYDLRKEDFNNQSVPLLVSNKGRYLWSEAPFAYQFKGGKLLIEPTRSEVTITKAGNTLREAYIAAAQKHFPPSGTIPPELFFTKPQYNTWIELIYNQNQKDVLAYAKAILNNGMPAGVIMIDDNWQKDYGNFEFRPDKFPDPKAMVEQLHRMGFKVMLWVCPFVSPDSQEYRALRDKGYLVKKRGSDSPAILERTECLL